MQLTNAEIRIISTRLRTHPKILKRKLSELDKEFLACACARNWGGCLDVIRAENNLLQIYPHQIATAENN
jgi:hypothetical protein